MLIRHGFEEELPHAQRKALRSTTLDPAIQAAIQAHPELIHDGITESFHNKLAKHFGVLFEHMGYQDVEQYAPRLHPEYPKDEHGRALRQNEPYVMARPRHTTIAAQLGRPMAPELRAHLTQRRDDLDTLITRTEQGKRDEQAEFWGDFCSFYNCSTDPRCNPDWKDPANPRLRPKPVPPGMRPTPLVRDMNAGNMDIKLAYTLAIQRRSPAHEALNRIQDLTAALHEHFPSITPIRDFRGHDFSEIIGVLGQLRAAHEWGMEHLPRSRTSETETETALPVAAETLSRKERERLRRQLVAAMGHDGLKPKHQVRLSKYHGILAGGGTLTPKQQQRLASILGRIKAS